MVKNAIAGLLGLVVAAALGVIGYQAGLFDGFRPQVPDAPQVAHNGEGAGTPATTAQSPDAKSSAASGDVTAPAEARAPTFDIVRIEPSGDAVVAGLSEPKSTVALIANGSVVGKTTANASGEWAIVLADPLKPGDYDVAISAVSEDGKVSVDSRQRVTVSIPKDQKDEVLVVMNAEGEASTILQKPLADASQGGQVVAGGRDTAVTEKTQATAALQEKSGQSAKSASGAGSEGETATESATQTADASSAPTGENSQTAETASDPAATGEPAAKTPETTVASAGSADGSSGAAEGQDAATGAGSSAGAVAEAPAGASATGSDANETAIASAQSGDTAGDTSASATDTAAASASGEGSVADGSATVADASGAAPVSGPETEAASAPANGSQETGSQVASADAGESQSTTAGEAASSGATPSAPAGGGDEAAPGTPQVADAQGTDVQVSGTGGSSTVSAGEATSGNGSAPVTSETEVAAIADGGGAPAAGAAPASDDKPAVSVEAVETEKGKLFVAGNSDPGSDVRVYVGEEHVGDARANADGRWLLEAPKGLEAGQHEVRADQVADGGGDTAKVVARAEVTFEREKDDVILRPVSVSGDASGSGSAGNSASATVGQLPNVIIRRGDNLWRISQRLYGQGLRYTTIYQANKNQIRNPDLIYPGQVFLTPEGDTNWQDQAAN